MRPIAKRKPLSRAPAIWACLPSRWKPRRSTLSAQRAVIPLSASPTSQIRWRRRKVTSRRARPTAPRRHLRWSPLLLVDGGVAVLTEKDRAHDDGSSSKAVRENED